MPVFIHAFLRVFITGSYAGLRAGFHTVFIHAFLPVFITGFYAGLRPRFHTGFMCALLRILQDRVGNALQILKGKGGLSDFLPGKIGYDQKSSCRIGDRLL